jgi:excisionase family DNA binding protein
MDTYRTPPSPAPDSNRCQFGKTETVAATIQADQIFTVQEAANYLKVKTRTIYNLIAEGKLKAKRINKWNYRILKSNLDRFMSR